MSISAKLMGVPGPKLLNDERVTQDFDHYLRQAMAATLARQDVEFDFLVQVQTDAHRMPVENASVRWPERLSRPVPVATLRLPR